MPHRFGTLALLVSLACSFGVDAQTCRLPSEPRRYPLAHPRTTQFSTTVIDDGILVAGDDGVEMIDGDSLVSRSVSSPPIPLGQHSTVRLNDGRVAFFRGGGAISIFDPGTGAWLDGGSGDPGALGEKFALPDGRVVIFAGRSDSTGVYVWDPLMKQTTLAGGRHYWSYGTAILLADGKTILGVCGREGQRLTTDAEFYDTTTGTSRVIGLSGSVHETSAMLSDGKVLLSGPGSEIEIFDPTTSQFTPTTIRATPLEFPEAAPLGGDRFLMISYGFNLSTRSWNRSLQIYDHRHEVLQTAPILPSGKVVTVGDRIFVLEQNTFVSLPAITPQPRATTIDVPLDLRGSHVATKLDDDTILFLGNADRGGYVYDPRNGALEKTPPLAAPLRFGFVTTRLHDGRILIVDGQAGQIYDPATGEFSAAGELLEERSDFTLTTLLDGRVMVIGGTTSAYTAGATEETIEIFDPMTRAFTTLARATPRYGHTATLLENGNVLIAGGRNRFPRDPRSGDGVFSMDEIAPNGSVIRSLPFHRGINHVALRLHDGRVLFGAGTIGGYMQPGEEYRLSVWDPWTAEHRYFDAPLVYPGGMVELPDGSVEIGPGIRFCPDTGAFVAWAITASSGELTLVNDGLHVLISGSSAPAILPLFKRTRPLE